MVILLIIAAIVSVLIVVVATQPNDFRITRSTTIAAPSETVFVEVNDFHKWETWSPWAKLDANYKNVFAGAAVGKGAIFSGDGNNQIGAGT